MLEREGANFQLNQYTLPYYVKTLNGQASKADLWYIYFVGALANSHKATLEVGSQLPCMREAASTCSIERIEAQ